RFLRPRLRACRAGGHGAHAAGAPRYAPHLQPVRGARARPRCPAPGARELRDRHRGLLPGAAAPAAVLCVLGSRRRRFSPVRAGGGGGSRATDFSGAHRNATTIRGRFDRCALPRLTRTNTQRWPERGTGAPAPRARRGLMTLTINPGPLTPVWPELA